MVDMKNKHLLESIALISDEIELFIDEESVLHTSVMKVELLEWIYTGTRLCESSEQDLSFIAGSDAMTGTKNQMLSHQFCDLSFMLWCLVQDDNPRSKLSRKMFEKVINKES